MSEQNQDQDQNSQPKKRKAESSYSAVAPDELDALMDEALGINEDFDSQAIDQESAPESPGQGFGADACGAMLGTAFDILAVRRGEHWKLKPEESLALGVAVDGVLEKYLPGLADRIGPEGALAMTAFAILMPRIKADQTELENAEK